jgi:hypothetical protein
LYWEKSGSQVCKDCFLADLPHSKRCWKIGLFRARHNDCILISTGSVHLKMGPIQRNLYHLQTGTYSAEPGSLENGTDSTKLGPLKTTRRNQKCRYIFSRKCIWKSVYFLGLISRTWVAFRYLINCFVKASASGRPDWANFCPLGYCFLWICRFSKIPEVAQTFFDCYSHVIILTKMGWDIFWAIF